MLLTRIPYSFSCDDLGPFHMDMLVKQWIIQENGRPNFWHDSLYTVWSKSKTLKGHAGQCSFFCCTTTAFKEKLPGNLLILCKLGNDRWSVSQSYLAGFPISIQREVFCLVNIVQAATFPLPSLCLQGCQPLCCCAKQSTGRWAPLRLDPDLSVSLALEANSNESKSMYVYIPTNWKSTFFPSSPCPWRGTDDFRI